MSGSVRGERRRPRPSTSLPRTFYDRPTPIVARSLLGCELLVRAGTAGGPRWAKARIVETEAYVAGDSANHAARGMTPRNRSMFLGPGHLYVYRIHQVCCANATTAPGEAVLLRAAEPLPGTGASTQGPGRLCRAMGISLDDDGEDLVGGRVRILPGRRGVERVVTGPRVGIRRSRDLPLRFFEEGSPWVSRPRAVPGQGGGRR